MYVQDLRISGIKLIKELHLDFKRAGEPRMWTVLLGENGTCKTTLLQPIALAAGGASKANQLLPNASSLRTIGTRRGGSIDVTFSLPVDDRRRVPIPTEGWDFAIPVSINSRLTLRDGWNELAGVSRWGAFNRPPEASHGQHVTTLVEPAVKRVRGGQLREWLLQPWMPFVALSAAAISTLLGVPAGPFINAARRNGC